MSVKDIYNRIRVEHYTEFQNWEKAIYIHYHYDNLGHDKSIIYSNMFYNDKYYGCVYNDACFKQWVPCSETVYYHINK
jgi:hypothetical protein